ncbi:MAG: sugar-transfer associated ATP-grasp domain-containing protein [Pseudomonadota bacterium]|nr:sugar-transfer associated ATP-grasp domain-containing protein [Pseudomonadota bacterium]
MFGQRQLLSRHVRRVLGRGPLDARGLIRPRDPDLRILEDRASELVTRRAPRLLRPLLRPFSVLVWILACLLRLRRAARIAGWRLAPQVVGHSIARGNPVDETAVLRMAFPGQWRRLPARRVANLMFESLADRAQYRMLSDKVATAGMLARCDVPVPPTIAVLDHPRDLPANPALWAAPADYFVKPVTGSHGNDAFRLSVLADGQVAIDGAPPRPAQVAISRLTDILRGGRLLVQPCLRSDMVLPFASPDAPAPVLRVTTTHARGQPPALHGAYLTLFRPGQTVARLGNGAIRFPVNPDTGLLLPGLRMASPGERHACDPWSGRAVAGTMLPAFDDAVAAALRAHARFDGVVCIGWDVILTAAGPVILEGNVMLGWMLPNLWHLETGTSSPMAGLLAQCVRHDNARDQRPR